jgi:glycolate oxidase FAD binding subunit
MTTNCLSPSCPASDMDATIESYANAIRSAGERGQALCLRGSGSKDFYGGPLIGDVLDTTSYCGIVDYEPTELVITARGGTPLHEVEAALARQGQMLAFEPPHFGPGATLGGCVAAGLSGPRRAYQGAVRDFVLGTRVLDGRGTDLHFGGQVMKNVAGYDVSRALVGSLGTLAFLLEVSLKVLPRPVAEVTLRLPLDEAQAIVTMNRWAGQPFPVSATCYHDGALTVRLSGAVSAVRAARAKIGGEVVSDGESVWSSIREHSAPFFRAPGTLWRLSVPSTTPPLALAGAQLIEWGGALRWWKTEDEPDVVRAAATRAGGHATLFRSQAKPVSVFQPLAPALLSLHRRLKHALDPHGVFGRQRLYDAL